jgi:hypothetical protein
MKLYCVAIAIFRFESNYGSIARMLLGIGNSAKRLHPRETRRITLGWMYV